MMNLNSYFKHAEQPAYWYGARNLHLRIANEMRTFPIKNYTCRLVVQPSKMRGASYATMLRLRASCDLQRSKR